MTKRSIIFAMGALIGGLGLFLGGWRFGSQNGQASSVVDAGAPSGRRETATREPVEAENGQRIAQLERDLKAARRQVEEQRGIIREHTLKPAGRSVDEMLALFPAKFPEGDWGAAEKYFEDCWFETVDGIRLHGWYMRHAEPEAVILYAHGNAGNLTHRAAIAASLHGNLRASILLFDYRGYGRSEGVPTMEGIVRDARAARQYLVDREGIAPEEIVLLGRSLGGAVAVQLAAEDGARGLILESTFSSLCEVASANYPDLLVNLLVADRLDSVEAIRNYHGPLLQSHGERDEVIPFALGQALFDAANEPKTFVRIPGGGHNDRPSEEYYDQLRQFIRALPDVRTE